jgi:hypothetical protein
MTLRVRPSLTVDGMTVSASTRKCRELPVRRTLALYFGEEPIDLPAFFGRSARGCRSRRRPKNHASRWVGPDRRTVLARADRCY